MDTQKAETADIAAKIEHLKRLTVNDLQDEYLKRYGNESRSSNRQYLLKKLAYRIQEQREGGMSPSGFRRIQELSQGTELRVRPPKEVVREVAKIVESSIRDPRLPKPGTVLTKDYDGKTFQVTVRTDDFEYKGLSYRSLSAVAKEISGTSWNGFLFFGLQNRSRKKNGSDA